MVEVLLILFLSPIVIFLGYRTLLVMKSITATLPGGLFMHRHQAFLCLFSLCFFSCKPSASIPESAGESSANVNTISLRIQLNPNEDVTPADARSLVNSANACLRDAYAFAKATQPVPQVEIESIQTAPTGTSGTWKLEPYDMAIDENGNEFEHPSCKTNTITTFLGAPAQARKYGAPGSDNHRFLKEWAQLRAYADCRHPGGCSAPHTEQELSRLTERLISMAERYMKFPAAPAVWMNKPRDYGETAYIVFTHELVHAWGGLDDRYHNPEVFDQTNLMGNAQTHLCRLTPDQIAAIEAYRSRCEPEDLGERRMAREAAHSQAE
jgi:hypothetical protein